MVEGKYDVDPSVEQIKDWFKYLVEISEERPFNIQISGGEPTVRDDLPEIIKMGKQMGIPYIQLNTNGLRLAEDITYVKRLKDAGLSVVFLQFDGTTEPIYQKIRGKDLLGKKMKAIENCAKHQLGTVLVPTLVSGVNTDNIGAIIKLAVDNLPTVRGVHFQPVSYFGKYPEIPNNSDRITLPEVMRYIENQTDGKIKAKDLKPLKSGCPYCSFTGSFVYMEDREIISVNKGESCSCKCNSGNTEIMKARDFVLNKWVLKEQTKIQSKASQYDFSLWDNYINRVQNYGFSITCMAFQDVWNLDIERLKKYSFEYRLCIKRYRKKNRRKLELQCL